MSATIHFDEKYKAALMEGFDKASETDGLFDHSLDMEFSGVKTVHVKSLRTEPLQDYDRTKGVGTGSRYGDTKARWKCVCDCGLTVIATANNLRNGNTKSCGCLRRETASKRGKDNTVHGNSHDNRTRLYSIWCGMRQTPTVWTRWRSIRKR